MNGMATVIASCVLVCLAWLVLGFINAIRSRLADRMASWLLPAGQPTTVRLAQGLALCASKIAPSRRIMVRFADEDEPFWHLICPGLSASTEVCPAALVAQAEIEEDLEADVRVIAPVRFVLPVLLAAVVDRLHNGREYCSLALRISVAVLVFPLALALGIISSLLIHAAAAVIAFTNPKDSLARNGVGPTRKIVKHVGECILAWEAVLWGIPLVLLWLMLAAVGSSWSRSFSFIGTTARANK